MVGAPAIYVAIDCANCGEEFLYGRCVTLTVHDDGTPVFPWDLAAQTSFRCAHCRAENYTGDFEVFSEGGDDA